MEFGHSIGNLWNLDENITFLNHGSFGATPKSVINAYNDWYLRLEKEPVQFFLTEYMTTLRQSADRLAQFVGAKGEDLVFVDNASSGMNAVLRSLMPGFSKEDIILTTENVYTSVKNCLLYISKITGCRIIELPIPYPVENEEVILNIFSNAINDRVKLIVVDHIFYTTSLILPIKKICDMAHSNGIPVVVDGAHAPGMIELNIEDLGCDWYTGNCHKWMFTPKGCALLWVSPEKQAETYPLCISNFQDNGFTASFDWCGTKNPAPYLSVDSALDFINHFGKENIQKYIHELAIDAKNRISSELNFESFAPNNMLGALVTLPFDVEFTGDHNDSFKWRTLLYEKYNIEVSIIEMHNRLWFRFTSQIYNEINDYDKLIFAIKEVIKY